MADKQEKIESSDIKLTSSNKSLLWLDNFWFYHKWKVIVIAFFAIVAVVGIVQMVNKEDPDVEVTVATHTIYYAEQVDSLEKTLLSLMPSDINGDGKKNVQINLYKIYSESELKDANEAETDAGGNPVIYADEEYNKSQINQFNSYIMTGQCSVMILSEYVYSELVNRRSDESLLTPVSEIFEGEMPKGVTSDGYGIRLTETGAYKNLEAFRFLPDDSVICIIRPFVMGGNVSAERHEAAVVFFKNIVEFGN